MSGIPLSVPNFIGNELKYVTDAVNMQWVSTGGSYITRFEDEFATYAKVEAAAAVQSGTAALHLAMLELGIGASDLVIVPTLTFIAAVNPVRYVGAQPVFMDCDDSLCMDAVKLERYLENECEKLGDTLLDKSLNKPVKAIIIVHVFGNGADMEQIMDIAVHYGLPVIEDATEAVGTFYTSGRYTGKMAGTIGDIGAYSFNGNKIITTGGGGMFVARDQSRTKHAKHLSTQAKSDELRYDHDEVGYNYRMTNLQAALGVAQLEQIEQFIEIKRENYNSYHEFGISLLPFSCKIRPNYWFYSYETENPDKLITYLEENSVQSRPIWKLIHTLPMYNDCRAYDIKKAATSYDRVVNLPCSSNLKCDDIRKVTELIKSFKETHR